MNAVVSSNENELVLRKGRELFAACDRDGKGYMTRTDLHRVGRDLKLGPVQLAAVFQRLDGDMNGYLTEAEFLAGFAEFLEARKLEEPDGFDLLLDHTGARGLFSDELVIRGVWDKLKTEHPSALPDLESFLGRVAADLRRSQVEASTLHDALEKKASSYEERLRLLQDELESQLKADREQLLAEEKARERRMREDLENQMKERDQQLQELMAQHSQMEKRLHEMNSGEAEAKQENAKLSKEHTLLEQQLELAHRAVGELKQSLELLQHNSVEERRRRARAALQVTESIAMEREELVRQLDMLRSINRQLLDVQDEQTDRFSMGMDCVFGVGPGSPDSGRASAASRYTKRGSVMGDYLDSSDSSSRLSSLQEVEQMFAPANKFSHAGDNENGSSYHGFRQPQPVGPSGTDAMGPLMAEFLASQREPNSLDEDELEEDELEEEIWNPEPRLKEVLHPIQTSPPISNKQQLQMGQGRRDPQRLFKVVFIGDSGVGKSSFIHRFCSNSFRGTFSATIGVDFQIKHVESNGQTVMLQLWDTAGQERFRSISTQYLRKADGVIIMYDITSETSFKNVRNWMICVNSSAEPETVVLVVGNKIDLCPGEIGRAVKPADGIRLAEECLGLFFETSAKEGSGVTAAMEALSGRLQVKEDQEIQRVLRLHVPIKRRRCC